MMQEKKSFNHYVKYKISFDKISPIELELFNIFLIDLKIGSLEERENEYFFYLPIENRYFLLNKIINYLKFKSISYKIELVEKIDDSYLYEWEKYLKPIIIENFIITPSWYNLKKIVIDTPLAFGTGQHPTTHSCIELIIKLKNNFQINSFLDAGCGSGILSIIADKLNIKKIFSFDIDKQAVFTAHNNFHKNRCNKISLFCGSFECLNKKVNFDLVCANMLSKIILKNKDILIQLVNKDKFLVISGIEINEKENFLKNFISKDIILIEEKIKNEWCSFVFQKIL